MRVGGVKENGDVRIFIIAEEDSVSFQVKINGDFKLKHFSLLAPEWCQHEIGMALSCQLAMLVVSS